MHTRLFAACAATAAALTLTACGGSSGVAASAGTSVAASTTASRAVRIGPSAITTATSAATGVPSSVVSDLCPAASAIAADNGLSPAAVILEEPTQAQTSTTCSYSVSSGSKPGSVIIEYGPYNNGQQLCNTLSGAGVADSSCAVIQKGSRWFVLVTSLPTPAQMLLTTVLTSFG